MNKKKSRKSKKRRDNDHKPGSKPTQSQSQSQPKSKSKSNDKYLNNFNLSDHQQSAVKFLSEALSISSQEAHIICNECKWEQSEFPSNLEDAQSMLHWNKNNTKSKRKREQNRYKKTQDQNKQKSNSTKVTSPTHSPSKSPTKSNHKHQNQNASAPKCGFIPHKTYANMTPNQHNDGSAHHSSHQRHNKNKSNSNRCLIKSTPRVPPKSNENNKYNHFEATHSNGTHFNSPPSNLKVSKSMGHIRYRGRGRSRGAYAVRGHPPYSSRGRTRGRGRGRGAMNVNYDKGRTDSTPSSSSKSVEESENMYLSHETLEEELRSKQYAENNVNNICDITQAEESNVEPQESDTVLIKRHENEQEHIDNHGSRRISLSPEKEKEASPMKIHAPISQEAFLRSHLPENNEENESKEQSFMFTASTDAVQNVAHHEDAERKTENVAVDEKHDNIENVSRVAPPREQCDEYIFSDKYAELFQILNGVLIVGYSGDIKPPHLCMPFDRLLDLINYQNGEALTLNDLTQWYKTSKTKLTYAQHSPFTHQSTQTLFDNELREKKRAMSVNNNQNQKEVRCVQQEATTIDTKLHHMNNRNKSQEIIAKKESNTTIKKNIRKPTRPPMSAKYNLSLKDHHMQMDSKSVPNEAEKRMEDKEQQVMKQRALNLNAKTFEPKSRSSSRTKRDHEGGKEKQTTSKSVTPRPALSNKGTASNSVTPQIEEQSHSNMNNTNTVQQQLQSVNLNLTKTRPQNVYHHAQQSQNVQRSQHHRHRQKMQQQNNAQHAHHVQQQQQQQQQQQIQQQIQQQQQQLMNPAHSHATAQLFQANPRIYKHAPPAAATQLFTQQNSPRNNLNEHIHHYAQQTTLPNTGYIVRNNHHPTQAPNHLQHQILTAPNAAALHSLNTLQGVGPLPPLAHQTSNNSLPSLPPQPSVEFQIHHFANNPAQPPQMIQHHPHHPHHHQHHHHHAQNGQMLHHNISRLNHHPLLQ